MSEISITAAMEQVSYMDPSSMQSINNNPHLSEAQKEQIVAKLFEAQLLRPVLKSAMNPTFDEAIGASAGSSTQRELATDLLVESMTKSATASFGLSSLMEMNIKGQ